MTIPNGLDHNELPFLKGGGKMGELIRSINWESTPLGMPSKWPSVLKQTVSMMLTTTFPVLICWGKEYTQLYNDAFRPINGETKHPEAMGSSAKTTYAEIWDTITPMFEEVMQGNTVSFRDHMVPLDRNGMLEECYFDFSYSPISDENGLVGGILVMCAETTEQVRTALKLASINEELASSIEEQAAANEEYAAMNEELRAANEELLKTKNDLLQSEKLFKSIALNIPKSLIIVVDKNHRFMAIEGDIMEKMGFDSRDYKGKHPTEVAPPERYEATKHLYERVLAGEKFSTERQSADTDDYFMVHFVPLKNDCDEVEAGLIIALEITDIKQAEEKSAKLAAIIELAQPTWITYLSMTLTEEVVAMVTNIAYGPVAQTDLWIEGLFAMDSAINQPLH